MAVSEDETDKPPICLGPNKPAEITLILENWAYKQCCECSSMYIGEVVKALNREISCTVPTVHSGF